MTMTQAPPAAGWVSSVRVQAGTAVLVRTSRDAEFRARLIHAAEVLGVVSGSGIERLVALEDDDTRTRLVTEFAGGRSVATAPPRVIGDLPAFAVALLDTLRELHARGVTHGPISASQVILGADDLPVLCDFSRGDHTDGSRLDARARADAQSAGRLLVDLASGTRASPVSEPVQWSRLRTFTQLSRDLAEGRRTGIDELIDAYRGIGTANHRRNHPDPSTESPAEPPEAPAVWVVRPGDHLWHIARGTLTVRNGRAPTHDELMACARRLVAANHDRFVDPANPDLIFPGQVLRLA